MCTVSMVSDWYVDKTAPRIDPLWPYSQPNWPIPYQEPYKGPTKEDFDKLLKKFEQLEVKPITREEIIEFRDLLNKAREYDKRTGQADCHIEDKIAFLEQLAKMLGVTTMTFTQTDNSIGGTTSEVDTYKFR